MTFPQQRIDRLTEQIRAALALTCPTCRVRAGNACVIDGDDEGVLIHAKRMAKSRRLVQITPEPVDEAEHAAAVEANRERAIQQQVDDRMQRGTAAHIEGTWQGVPQIISLDSRDGARFGKQLPGASVETPEGVVSLETYAMQLPTVEDSAARFHEAAAEEPPHEDPDWPERDYQWTP